MNRAEAAKFLGLSAAAVDALSAGGQLHPRYERRADSTPVPVYDEDDLTRLRDERAGRAAGPAHRQYPPHLWDILACAWCGSGLEPGDGGALCLGCSTLYPYTESGSLDLRPRRARTYRLDFEIPAAPAPGGAPPDPPPEIDRSRGRDAYHPEGWWRRHWPRPTGPGARMLDLGCGDVSQKQGAEASGFEYVGVDYDSWHAPLLGDAHALPFRDDSFEFISAIALLEHVRYPFVAMREAYRVLKPGGTILGTVSFLEPFHMSSYYHHTHLGTLNVLQFAGFRVLGVIPAGPWTGLVAQMNMGLFPGMPVRVARWLAWPMQSAHRVWWAARRGRGAVDERIRNVTGAFSFAASKG